MSLLLLAAARTRSANPMIVTSSSEPMLNTSPTALGVSISRITDSTASLTCPKHLDCSPVP